MPNTRDGASPGAAWRLLDTPPAAGAWNMALDEALAEGVRAGGPSVLRFYRWRPACLSLGRHQPAAGRYDQGALRERGIDVVRRPTGGRAVLHHRELTYTVAVPAPLLGGPRGAYAAVSRALVAGLRRLGIDARLQPATGRRAPAPSLAPCFAEPVEGEVMAGGRKLVGSAQRRLADVLLQHGSLPFEDDQREVRSLLLPGAADDERAAEEDDRPATLAALLGRDPAWEEVTAALKDGWEEALGVRLEPDEPTDGERARAEALEERYAGAAWTWHR